MVIRNSFAHLTELKLLPLQKGGYSKALELPGKDYFRYTNSVLVKVLWCFTPTVHTLAPLMSTRWYITFGHMVSII